MLKKIYDYYLKLNIKIKNLMKYGFIFSMFILIISGLILCTYELFYSAPVLYYIGLSFFKLSIIYFVTFLCFGFAFNKMIEEGIYPKNLWD